MNLYESDTAVSEPMAQTCTNPKMSLDWALLKPPFWHCAMALRNKEANQQVDGRAPDHRFAGQAAVGS